MINFINEFNIIFNRIYAFAEINQTCLRKAVGCAAIGKEGEIWTTIAQKHNGPSREGHECTNEVGNCGCSHSEPRVVIAALKNYCEDKKLILVCTYSPCTNCANIVIDSGLFGGVIYDILTEHDKRGAEFLEQAFPGRVMSREELNKLTEKEASDRIKEWISC